MKFKAGGRPGGRTVVIGAAALLWLGALVVGAVPVWRKALRQHREVRQVEAKLDDLDRWSVAGLWLERTLVPRQEAVTPVWDRLFPSERRCEALFLDLARVADESGVTKFELHELQSDEMSAEAPGVADPEPFAALGGYRVRARFEGDFAGVAGFLGGLGRLERAVAVHDLEIKPAKDAVQVDLELDVYVASTSES
jgi:hypothetical protein